MGLATTDELWADGTSLHGRVAIPTGWAELAVVPRGPCQHAASSRCAPRRRFTPARAPERDLIEVGTGWRWRRASDNLLELQRIDDDGRVDWRHALRASTPGRGVSFTQGSIVEHGSRIFVVTFELDGPVRIDALDVSTGHALRTVTIPTAASDICLLPFRSGALLAVPSGETLRIYAVDEHGTAALTAELTERWLECDLTELGGRVLLAGSRVMDGHSFSDGLVGALALHVLSGEGSPESALEPPRELAARVRSFSSAAGVTLAWSREHEIRVWSIDASGAPRGDPRTLTTLHHWPEYELRQTADGVELAWRTWNEQGEVPLCPADAAEAVDAP